MQVGAVAVTTLAADAVDLAQVYTPPAVLAKQLLAPAEQLQLESQVDPPSIKPALIVDLELVQVPTVPLVAAEAPL